MLCSLRPNSLSTGLTTSATAGSVTAPSPSDASVTPSWQADRYRSRRRLIASAMREKRLLDASVSRRDNRAETAANSAATKYALAATSASVIRILTTMSTGVLFRGRPPIGQSRVGNSFSRPACGPRVGDVQLIASAVVV